MASPQSVEQGFRLFAEVMGPSRRTAYIAQELANNPRLQAMLAEAAASDTPRVVLARIAAEFEPPAMDRAAAAYGGRGMPDPRPSPDAQLRSGVAGELGPYYNDAPIEQVNDARSMLDDTTGGEDLVARLEGMTPRPLYSLDMMPDTSIRSQADATYGPFAFPEQSQGLVPVAGRGVPVGGPTGSGVLVRGPRGLTTEVTPRTRLPGPPQRRIGTTAGVPVGGVTPRSSPRAAPVPEATRRLEAPEALAERHGMEDLAGAVAADEAAARAAREAAGRPGASLERAKRVAEDVLWRSLPVTAAAGGGVAAWSLIPEDGPTPADAEDAATPRAGGLSGRREARRIVPDVTPKPRAYSAPRPMVPDITSKPKPFSTADLAAETAPPPSVAVEAPLMIDYSQMARDKIRQANEIQLREGRITPESAALSREADALYQRAAEERRKGNHPGIMPVELQNEETSAIRARQRRAG